MLYAFLALESACEALRFAGKDATTAVRWPEQPRRLPTNEHCVHSQRSFRAFSSTVDLATYGIMHRPVDVLVSAAQGRSRGKLAYPHVWRHEIPAHAMLRLQENLLVSTPELVLMQMAGHHMRFEPLLDPAVKELRGAEAVQKMMGEGRHRAIQDNPFTWEKKIRLVGMALVAMEFAGTYRLKAGEKGTSFRQPQLMTFDSARDALQSVPDLYAPERVNTALGLAFERSASPMETALILMLTLPSEYGGYGLPRPELNAKLKTDRFAGLWDGGASITPDLLWRDERLVVEYDSDEEHALRGGRKAGDDATRANVLVAMGYRVLRVTTSNVLSLVSIGRVAQQIAACLGVALEEPDDIAQIRHHKLHALLMQQ